MYEVVYLCGVKSQMTSAPCKQPVFAEGQNVMLLAGLDTYIE